MRALDVGEYRAFDVDSGIAFDGALADFITDVFALSIAIGPYIQSFTVFSLPFNVGGYGLFVLRSQGRARD